MTPPDDAGEPITFELRATLADGSRLILGPYATPREAQERAYVLAAAHALRVELRRWVGVHVEVASVIGHGRQPDGSNASSPD